MMEVNVLLARAGQLIQAATHKGSSAAVGGGSGEAQHVAHLAQAAPEPVAVKGFQLGGIEVAGKVGQHPVSDEPVVAVEQDFGQHVALVAVEAGVLLHAEVVEAVGDGVAVVGAVLRSV